MLFNRCEFEGLREYVWRFAISIISEKTLLDILRVNVYAMRNRGSSAIPLPQLFQTMETGRERDYPGRDKEITVKRLDLSGRSGTSHSTTIKYRIWSNGTIEFRYN